MNKINLNTNNFIVDNILQKKIVEEQYKVVRVEDAVCDHITYVTAKSFFKKRFIYGVAIGELFMVEKRFIKMYLKFLVGIPLSRGRGELVYRVATLLGMSKYLVNKI